MVCCVTYFCKFAKNQYQMSDTSSSGIYIHIPFCRRKCIYCDFYSVGERCADWGRFADAVIAEARERVEAVRPDGSYTLYIGGGTPSLMPAGELRRIVRSVIGIAGKDPGEFTIEVNPDDVTEDMAAAWADCGINRVSMGVQSLVDSELRFIGRRHDAAGARKAFETLRRHFSDISLDLMFGLPYQTLESLQTTLRGFLEMRPEHVSAYSLMYEERTALTRMRDKGSIEEAPEDISVEMFRMVGDVLAGAGYGQYEISNYSLPGRRSRHNSSYWQGSPYIGLGPGAHSYDGHRLRRANLPDVRLYLKALKGENSDGENGNGEKTDEGKTTAWYETETLGDDELREEMIMTRLRTREGISLPEFESRFGNVELGKLLKAAGQPVSAGLLKLSDGESLSLTREGIMVSDEVMTLLF